MITMVFDFFGVRARQQDLPRRKEGACLQSIEGPSQTEEEGEVEDPLVSQQGSTFDHILTPEKIGDHLAGHYDEADRFVFNDPSLSPNLNIWTVRGDVPAVVDFLVVDNNEAVFATLDADLRGRELLDFKGPMRYRGSLVMSDAVQVEDFNPDEGDVLDFSGLGQNLSFSGHTPQPYSVWTDTYELHAQSFPLKIDLDGEPESIEMGIYLVQTHADSIERMNEVNRDLSIFDVHKEMADDMFILA